MSFRRHLNLLCLAAALCAGAIAPASALGAERVARPVQTNSLDSGWTIAPASSLAHQALADAVVAPAVPDTTTGYLASRANGPVAADIGFAAPAISTGETVSGTRLRAYFETGSARSLQIELWSGLSWLGFAVVPAGQPAGWHDINAWSVPTLAQLSNLRMRATVNGNGTSSDVKFYAAYVSVTTSTPADGTQTQTGTGDVPTTTSGDDPAPGGSDDGASQGDSQAGDGPQVDAAVAVTAQTLKVASTGVLHMEVACRLAAGCTGTVSTRLIGADKARASRRRKVASKRSKNRFRIAAGQSKQVPVQLDRRTSRFVRRKGRAKVAVTIAVDGAAPVTKQVTVVERRGAARRSNGRRSTGGRSTGSRR